MKKFQQDIQNTEEKNKNCILYKIILFNNSLLFFCLKEYYLF